MEPSQHCRVDPWLILVYASCSWTLSEAERMQAIRVRTDQIEAKAKMQEQKLRLIQGPGGSDLMSINQSIAVNDIYIDSIQAKLKILENI